MRACEGALAYQRLVFLVVDEVELVRKKVKVLEASVDVGLRAELCGPDHAAQPPNRVCALRSAQTPKGLRASRPRVCARATQGFAREPPKGLRASRPRVCARAAQGFVREPPKGLRGSRPRVCARAPRARTNDGVKVVNVHVGKDAHEALEDVFARRLEVLGKRRV